MKRILLIVGFLLALGAPSYAASCAGTFQIKDNAAATGTVVYTDSGDGSGNCVPDVKVFGTAPVSVGSGGIASGAIASGAVASGAFASGSIGSGAIASGAVASGAVASGAFASGSIASGAIVSGADVTEGTTAETTVYAGTGGCTVVACLKGIYAGVTSVIPTQVPTVSIGGVGIIDSAGTNVATVKAASTLPVASDKTLVVGLNPGTATAGSPTGAILSVQGVSGGQALPVSGTFYQATQPVSIASAQVASGAFASGSIASGAIASGAIASGAVASGAIASGALASGAGTDGWNATLGAKADTVCATATGTCSEIALIKYLNNAAGGPIAAGTNLIGKVGIDQTTDGTTNGVRLTSQYPATAVPITASATGTTAATTATLTNVSGHTTYICWYSIRANATAATTVTDTITGVITGTLSSALWVAPLASGLGVDEMIFTPCVPASAVSTSIAVVSGAPGSGGTVTVKAGGYSL